MWLEKHSHDPDEKGYYQHLRRDGSKVIRDASVDSRAETGYKDQNSSIHLLEAFSELYKVWPDPLVRERLEEMLYLIRDTITTDKGYLTLFLTTDWKPVSFRDSSHEVIEKHHGLDHVSFGHDVETAYLVLEAAEVLGLRNDTTTLWKAKKMVDHALHNGWDNEVGGFYDGGYYFKDKSDITIVKDSKTWWAQAEGMNTLLIMAEKFPDDPMNYFEKFRQLWQYIDNHVIDHTYGDWYWGGLDKEPRQKTTDKGSIWKATYHHYRGMTHSIDMLRRSAEH
jgi:mannobiose 2-epimerase